MALPVRRHKYGTNNGRGAAAVRGEQILPAISLLNSMVSQAIGHPLPICDTSGPPMELGVPFLESAYHTRTT